MARPRKMTVAQMEDTVMLYYTQVAEGNMRLMKFSKLAEYAQTLGYDAEGYDFRRCETVRSCLDNLKNGGMEIASTDNVVYKNLDINAFIHRNSGEKLKTALAELDAYWNRVSEFAVSVNTKKHELSEETDRLKLEMELLKREAGALSRENNKISIENRYLRAALKKYLYPSVADEILKSENAIENVQTRLRETAASDFIEKGHPLSLDKASQSDARMQFDVNSDGVLDRLWGQCDE